MCLRRSPLKLFDSVDNENSNSSRTRFLNISLIAAENSTKVFYLYSPCNMVAQANNTGTSKNTTNEKEIKIMTVPLYTHKLKH